MATVSCFSTIFRSWNQLIYLSPLQDSSLLQVYRSLQPYHVETLNLTWLPKLDNFELHQYIYWWLLGNTMYCELGCMEIKWITAQNCELEIQVLTLVRLFIFTYIFWKIFSTSVSALDFFCLLQAIAVFIFSHELDLEKLSRLRFIVNLSQTEASWGW